jgi:hypothetical protein
VTTIRTKVLAAVALLSATYQARAECTKSTPCVLQAVTFARKRLADERSLVAKMADTPATEHNINVTNRLMDHLKEGILLERNAFSDWCALNHKLDAQIFEKSGQHLSSEEVFPWTGQPDEEAKQAQGPIEGKIWIWNVTGPLSGSVAFGVLFVRAAGSSERWVFSGCTWCASGGEITTKGCMELPWKP